MVDLETLGTDPYSPVLSIGAVRFRFDDEPFAVEDTFHQVISLESCMELGLRPSASTISWWMQQSAEARSIFTPNVGLPLPNVLDNFTDWWGSRPDEIWGNSISFDGGILKDAYRVCKKEVPWAFWKERCYRTMKSLPAVQDVSFERIGTHHNALDDALSQALHLREIYKALGLK